MIKRRMAVRLVSAVTLFAYTLTTLDAEAHNNETHQAIVNQAWQTMRAGTRSNLLGHIKWATPTPPAVAPDVSQPGDCALPASDPKNLCGKTVSPQEWTAFLTDIQVARHELSGILTELPGDSTNIGCLGYSPTQRLGAFARPVTSQHMVDSEKHEPRLACDFGGNPARGLFADFEAPDDGAGNQGLILGWHAQHRDDDQADTAIDVTLPVVGQILELATAIYELALAAVFLPFLCLASIFTGGDCSDKSQRLADDLDPVDYLKGILPGWRNADASENGRTLWHFINVQGGGLANEYDDNQGMYQVEAGPNQMQSGVDHAIVLAGDLLFLTLDASNSAGTERYEITSDETSFGNPSSDRGEVRWQMEAFPHTAFSPLDNFAYYGDMGRPDGHPGSATRGKPAQMGWPLHAIGDASVPMHVTGTSGWGHRPYEDAVTTDWRIHVFQECRAGDPCDPTLPSPDADFLKLNQLKQAHRVLQRGFRWLTYLRSHPDIRDFITQIAKDTLSASMAQPPSGTIQNIWCDSCSAGYAIQHQTPLEAFVVTQYTTIWQEGVINPIGYYQGLVPSFQTASGQQYFRDNIFEPTRQLLEQALGATLGYLVFRGGASNCAGLSASCANDGQCCSGECASLPGGAKCCRAGAAACSANSECCSGSCVNEVCASNLGDTCRTTSCTSGQCVNGICCQTGTQACTANGDCCSGNCQQGQCVASTCSVTGCSVGQTCSSSGGCCNNTAQTCTASSQCCSGACGISNNKCLANVTESCSTDDGCSTGLCVGGKCCNAVAATCLNGQVCCSGKCGANGACEGLPFGAACADFSQCASGICLKGTCSQVVK